MRHLVCLSLLVSSLFSFLTLPSVWASSIIAEDRLENTWTSHVASFGLDFVSQEEQNFRKAIFKETDEIIQKHNSEGHTFSLGHNQFSTMTHDEFIKGSLGLELSSSLDRQWPQNMEMDPALSTLRDIPQSYDLRTATTCGQSIPVKQQPCGCCWAFTAIAPIEYSNCVANGGNYVQFSEAQLNDCSIPKNRDGCNGYSPIKAWNWLIESNSGLVDTASSYPFTNPPSSGPCNQNNAEAGPLPLASFTVIPYNSDTIVTDIQNALLTYGMLSAFVMVSDKKTGQPFFRNYNGSPNEDTNDGVFIDPACGKEPKLNHGVSLVGWGTSPTGIDYWIMRNQWDVTWGIGGYMNIQRGTNMCGIEKVVSYVSLGQPTNNRRE